MWLVSPTISLWSLWLSLSSSIEWVLALWLLPLWLDVADLDLFAPLPEDDLWTFAPLTLAFALVFDFLLHMQPIVLDL